MLEFSTITANIIHLAETSPQHRFARLRLGGGAVRDLNYGDVLREGNRFASFFDSQGVRQGDIVIILCQHGEALVHGFTGSLLLGAVPSIFAPPSAKLGGERYFHSLAQLLASAGSRFLLADNALAQQLKDRQVLPPAVRVLDATAAGSHPTALIPRKGKEEDLAILQYSSGTTGLRKGVALDHRACLNQLRHYAKALGLDRRDSIASWLPLYHDMGLIAAFCLPLTTGTSLTLMSPFHWIVDPASLLRLVHEEKSTLCWLPNFAFQVLATRIPASRTEGLDLSSLRAWISCSEPIRHESLKLFHERYRDNGVAWGNLGTCYAMAENTFAVSQSRVGQGPAVDEVDAETFSHTGQARRPTAIGRATRRQVSSGKILEGNRVRIVSATGEALPDRRQGEIWIQSDSMLFGYHARAELTAAALRDGWYQTGDLGYLSDGELYVTGRKKDLIIVAGKNIYPEDIEDIVSSVSGIYPGRCVAFGLFDERVGTEEVVVVAETDCVTPEGQSELRREMAKRVRDELECTIGRIHLVPARWLVKSSSGKISRTENRKRYETLLKDQHA